jgi:hypothetical protein
MTDKHTQLQLTLSNEIDEKGLRDDSGALFSFSTLLSFLK